MGALAVIILWLGINIIIDLFCEDKSKKQKTQIKKRVIREQERIYDFDLFADLEESQVSYLKKSA